jgi:hypothetical protein
MERNFCDIIFNTSAPISNEPIKHNNEPIFDWNCNEDAVDFLNIDMYDNLLNEDKYNQIPNEYPTSEWESCVSDDSEDEHEADVDDFLLQTIPQLTQPHIQIAKRDETSDLINFCQILPKQLPKFCDFDQIDAGVREEMEATEKDTVNMDLLTCSAATANCYRESSHKPLIRSKYGKWSCSGRSNPNIGLGPLSQLFMNNYVTNKVVNEQNKLEINQNQILQTNIEFVPTVNNHHKVEAEFEFRDYDRDVPLEFADNYEQQVFYNRDYNHLFSESQNNYCTKNTFCNDKCCKSDIQSQQLSAHCQQMPAPNSCGWHYNYSYNNYNCEQNLIQSTFY